MSSLLTSNIQFALEYACARPNSAFVKSSSFIFKNFSACVLIARETSIKKSPTTTLISNVSFILLERFLSIDPKRFEDFFFLGKFSRRNSFNSFVITQLFID